MSAARPVVEHEPEQSDLNPDAKLVARRRYRHWPEVLNFRLIGEPSSQP